MTKGVQINPSILTSILHKYFFYFYFRSLVGKCAEPGGKTVVICAACARNAWRDQMFRNTFLKGVEYNSVRFYEPLCRANIKNQNVHPPPRPNAPLKKICFVLFD